MSSHGVLQRLRRDPGLALMLLAIVAAFALYAPTLMRGLVNLDDPWLISDNWILHRPSLASLRAIITDTSFDTRAVLGAEYLPVRDLSVMTDIAIWGDNFGGFHLTNVLVYVCAIALWFGALTAFGVDRTIAGLAVLLWAVHPAHAESVAWLSERKGLLGIAFAGASALGYARFRRGASTRWLALAMLAAVFAVWSKALAAFAIAGIAGLEVALPGRVSVKRSLIGLGAIAAVTVLAFIPVLVVAGRMSVVGGDVIAPGGVSAPAMVLGVHGFYVRLAAMTLPNAVTYPINSDGPTTVDVLLGALVLAAIAAVALVPRMKRWQPSPLVRAGALIWAVGWFPASRIVLPVRLVVAADRYLLFPTLGLALVVAAVILALPRQRLLVPLAAVLVVASSARTLVAQASWQDARTLWSRAVESNPRDADAWSQYADALAQQGELGAALQIVDRGLAHSTSPRLLLRRALVLLRAGDIAAGRAWMQRAAEQGDPIAMANFALILHEAGNGPAALEWARKAVARAPLYVNGYRTLGKVALGLRLHDECYAAFARAYALEPGNPVNRFNLALALIALGRVEEARVHLLASAADPALAARANAELARLPR